MSLLVGEPESDRQRSGAVTDGVGRGSHRIEHRQKQICHRTFFARIDVATGLKLTARAAGHNDRQVMVAVAVGRH